jgi:hypothetical protein
MQSTTATEISAETRAKLTKVKGLLNDAAKELLDTDFKGAPLIKVKYHDLVQILCLNVDLIKRDLDPPAWKK